MMKKKRILIITALAFAVLFAGCGKKLTTTISLPSGEYMGEQAVVLSAEGDDSPDVVLVDELVSVFDVVDFAFHNCSYFFNTLKIVVFCESIKKDVENSFL